MKNKSIVITLCLLIFQSFLFAQIENRQIKHLQFNSDPSELKICFDCDYNIIAKQIRQRISKYIIDTNFVFRLEKADTLFEIVRFNKNNRVYYSYYWNNLLKVDYNGQVQDSSNYQLIIMDNSENWLKDWVVEPNGIHITDWDGSYNMVKYFAEIFKDNNIKIECLKEWKSGNFIYGKSKTLKKDNKGEWILLEKVDIGVNDWPK